MAICLIILNKKSYKPRKPDSVSTLSFIYDKHYCLPVAAYPDTSNEPFSNVSIRGITVPKVYPHNTLLHCVVGSYPTFSPSSQIALRQLFSVALSLFVCTKAGYSPVGCPILSRLSSSNKFAAIVRVCSRCKVSYEL